MRRLPEPTDLSRKRRTNRGEPPTYAGNLWTCGWSRRAASAGVFTSRGGCNFPIWSPDGPVGFGAARREWAARTTLTANWRSGTGAKSCSRHKEGQGSERLVADGRTLLCRTQQPTTVYDVWALPLDTRKASPRPDPVCRARAVSPSGKWLATSPTNRGDSRYPCSRFRPAGVSDLHKRRRQVRWRPDGKEESTTWVRRTHDCGHTSAWTRWAISRGGRTAVGVFFTTRIGGALRRSTAAYLVSRDGQRFLMSTFKRRSAPLPSHVIPELEAEVHNREAWRLPSTRSLTPASFRTAT